MELTPYPFQRFGQAWLRHRRRALLADEMGLGKTVQALLAAPERARMLVVCPASVKGAYSDGEPFGGWLEATSKWRPDLSPVVLEGRGSFRWPEPGEVVILNYAILPQNGPAPPAGVVLVVDEAHYCKNPEAIRTTRCRFLAKAILRKNGRAWLLTGTPMKSNPDELWEVLELCDLGAVAFGHFDRFAELAGRREERVKCPRCNGGGRYYGRQCVACYGHGRKRKVRWEDVTEAMPRELSRVMLRRRRRSVFPEIKEPIYRRVLCEITAEAKEACDAWQSALEEHGIELHEAMSEAELHQAQTAAFDEMSRARSALSKAKIPALAAEVDEYEQNETPVVIFSAHRAPVEVAAERKGWVSILGDQTTEQRERARQAFVAGDAIGIAGTIGAMGTGIDGLQKRAADAIFVDWAWNPSDNRQAIARLNRHGQERHVTVTSLYADHAIDHHVTGVLARKAKLFGSVVDAAATTAGVS